ncbi:MAG TPA: hypothetical protein VK826_03250, partial [Bacteroidia bacterium]|nr:hypothetical protein [Bacteroidia bacterium]
FNFDAGVMVTDEKGFYAGVSVLNLLQPKLVFGFESPGTTEIYSLQTEQSYVAATGGLVGLNRHFDLMLDASASVSRGVQCVRPSAMVRFNHKIAIGSAVTIDSGSEPVYEVQGGYTSTPFKWLNTVSFTANGIVVETGVVVRFGVQRWRVTRLPVPCTTTPIPEPPRTEFSPSE